MGESKKEQLLRLIQPDFEITRGKPLPLGATALRGGINFSVFSRHGSSVTLVFFAADQPEPLIEFPLNPRYNRTGDVWHAFVNGLDPGIEYGYRIDGPNDGRFFRFNRDIVLIDPYARALSGGRIWNIQPQSAPRHSLAPDGAFDWENDCPLNIHLADSIIYEMHVRGFTRHSSSGVQHPGTFAGVVERIPYLKDLGITAVELMPVFEYDENDVKRLNPITGERLCNFWGYDPISFFAPKGGYAADKSPTGPIVEFKQMVKALHSAGIEVILDMVYNHTGESDETGPTLSLRGIDNPVYYMLNPETGAYEDFSGCGNTLNCNHPVVRSLIMDSLRYWVTEMHVDGFRFDLASILGRGQDGEALANAPLLERIAAEPVLANTKLIAEAWDAAGLYQVGTFPNWGRWAEWNGRFRDDIRRFIRAEPGTAPALATRMAGSSDLYQHDGRAPFHSVNFVTSHDGFTLADLVSYEEKHNESNGRDNRDGTSENLSWNCGLEGDTDDPEILRLRRRQIKNFATLLFFSQGAPMMLAGDEFGRSQQGDNNPYCHDSPLSWINWELIEHNQDLHRFFKRLIAFRKTHSILRRRAFFDPNATPTLRWHGYRLNEPDWSWGSRSIGMHVVSGAHEPDIYLIAHAFWEDRVFELPPLPKGRTWRRFIDTSLPAPEDIADPGDESELSDHSSYSVYRRSVVVLIEKPI